MAKNEVATTDKKFELVTLTGELAEAIAEEMDGLGSIPFERAKIPSGGGLAFELPGETEDEPVMSTELTGVILHHHPVNAYWAEQYSGGNEQPDCSSYDGKQGVERETGEIHDCSKCPHNQFGSAGAGKACKNIHRCYILQESNPVPIILALPPTSLKYIRDYIGKRILLKGLRCYEAVTKITLKKEKSADGITYSSRLQRRSRRGCVRVSECRRRRKSAVQLRQTKPGAETLLVLSKGGTVCRYYLITGPADTMTNA